MSGLSGPRVEADAAARQRLLEGFLGAAASGDLAALEALLTEGVTLYSDGGGKAAAAINPVAGPDRVARFMAGISGKAPEETTVDSVTLNGRRGRWCGFPGKSR